MLKKAWEALSEEQGLLEIPVSPLHLNTAPNCMGMRRKVIHFRGMIWEPNPKPKIPLQIIIFQTKPTTGLQFSFMFLEDSFYCLKIDMCVSGKENAHWHPLSLICE